MMLPIPWRALVRRDMSSSWFARPVYKQVRYFSIALLSLLFALGFSNNLFWITAAVYFVLWGVFTAYTAWRIESGYYVPTVNYFHNAGNRVCITFDDGPCEQTAAVLDKLKKSNAHASFFCIGEQVERYPDIARRIVEEGHTLGNHSFSHRSIFPVKGVSGIRKEIADTQNLIAKVTGRTPRFFRPPFSVTNPLIASVLENSGLTTVGWSIRSLDTVTRDRERVLERIRAGIKPGSIILLHDRVDGALELLDEVLAICREKRLVPVSLDEVIGK